ncbi:uncharacterized protein LOC131946472 [Physella acuta]|uniref:uncharacterized protein LOC131946472 n=1 Tax=Physella acuta TaxID=109671 RepID=UPI0027DDA223|nr:uncharacterized protein LOC131946472 [Physella acuta]
MEETQEQEGSVQLEAPDEMMDEAPVYRNKPARLANQPQWSKEPATTTSMLMFSNEEREERMLARLEKPPQCLKASWSVYDKLTHALRPPKGIDTPSLGSSTDPPPAIAPGDMKSMGVLYDPLEDKKRKFLNKRFKNMLDTFSMIREAPLGPYIRPTPPKLMDKPGRGKILPTILKTTRPDISVKFDYPRTFAATKRWTKIYNLNFEDEEEMREIGTQTLPMFVITSMGTLKKVSLQEMEQVMEARSKSLAEESLHFFPTKRTQMSPGPTEVLSRYDPFKAEQSEIMNVFQSQMDVREKKALDPMEEGEFDFEDIPYDSLGNPIGKTTGICEWCGENILPFPTHEMLKQVWDKSSLYCCRKYMTFVQDMEAMERKLAPQIKGFASRISIKPHGKRQSIRKASRAAALLQDSLKMAMLEAKAHEPMKSRRSSKQETRNKNVDTFDLPWDPYDTKIDQTLVFDEGVYFDPTYHAYLYPDVVALASGTYLAEDFNAL